MPRKISAVVNTLNEEANIARAIKSVKWCDEILVCDMHSVDKTVEIAKSLGARVVFHEKLEFVEPARNLGISEANGEWILILDPDEEIPNSLAAKLQQIAERMHEIDYVRLPRKNLIFGKWMKASMWWPDFNIRFFRKGKVEWTDKIHRPPQTQGVGIDLSEDERLSVIHHHYDSITQFLERMNRYTKIQAEELVEGGYKFNWEDLIKKPLGEFLGRFFANKGYADGIHGLVLSLLQSFSFLIVYLRIWEAEKFKQEAIDMKELEGVSKQAREELRYWFKFINLSKNPFKRFVQKVKDKV